MTQGSFKRTGVCFSNAMLWIKSVLYQYLSKNVDMPVNLFQKHVLPKDNLETIVSLRTFRHTLIYTFQLAEACSSI